MDGKREATQMQREATHGKQEATEM